MIMQMPQFSLSAEQMHIKGACQLVDFSRWLLETRQLRFDSYALLHQWSVDAREQFWQAYLDFSSITLLSAGAEPVLVKGEHLWLDRWFPGTSLNYAQNLLAFNDQRSALIFRDEAGHHDEADHHDEVPAG